MLTRLLVGTAMLIVGATAAPLLGPKGSTAGTVTATAGTVITVKVHVAARQVIAASGDLFFGTGKQTTAPPVGAAGAGATGAPKAAAAIAAAMGVGTQPGAGQQPGAAAMGGRTQPGAVQQPGAQTAAPGRPGAATAQAKAPVPTGKLNAFQQLNVDIAKTFENAAIRKWNTGWVIWCLTFGGLFFLWLIVILWRCKHRRRGSVIEFQNQFQPGSKYYDY